MRTLPVVLLALSIGFPAAANTFWRDSDRDGFGNAASPTTATFMPPGFADNPNDCNDNDANVHPGAGEACNGRDDNCNGGVDEGATPFASYLDFDHDGYGQDATKVLLCPMPAGRVLYGGDLNDSDPGIHPGATEICGNGIDEDCDGIADDLCGAPFAIIEVIDRPGDEGHAVLVRFHAHPYDVPAGAPVHLLEYRVQRRPYGAEGVPYTWETVATLLPAQLTDYEVAALTSIDAAPVTFVVRVIADVPGVAYDTAPDSGSSLDDTAPEPPAAIAATWAPKQVTLDWQPSPSPDVALYRVYRDPGCDLVPQCLPFVDATRSPSDPLSFTGAFDGRTHDFHYWVTAVDGAGNESVAAMPSLVGAPSPGSEGFELAPPSPNPSRGDVVFSWSLPADGSARLAIVDAAGRTVRVLTAGTRPAGPQRVTWDGRDARGQVVRAGAYFVRPDSPWGDRSRMLVRVP
jgi:hypothetical protein